MKTIISLTFGLLLALSATQTASAQVYYSYPNNYQYQNQNSYYYTSGCNQYYHDAYTNTERYVRYVCQNQNTYTYVQPVTYTYYTQPTTYTSYNASSYYTYGYNRGAGTWYPRYSDPNNIWSFFGSNNTTYYNNSYDNGFVYTPTTNCYTMNGYYICQ